MITVPHMVKGYSLGAKCYVCKAVDFERFTEAVKQLKLYWRVFSERAFGRGGSRLRE